MQPTETVISPDQLLRLLQQTLGTKVELVDYKIANHHHDYLVLLVQLRHPSTEVVIKLAGPEAEMASSFNRTAMLHELVAAHTTIPMPEILAVDTSYQAWPWRYLIKRAIPGQEWASVRRQMNSEELSSAYQQMGLAVAQLHTIQFPMFGELCIDGSVRGSESFLTAFIERAKISIKSARLHDLFFSVLDEHRHLFLNIRQASLCHEDLHQHNILFQVHQGQWRLAAILDFDKAWAGHSEIDLARLDFWRGMLMGGFWQAYKAIHPVEPLYEQRRPIYQLLWCFEFARSTAEHLADTQHLCAELGIACPERFD